MKPPEGNKNETQARRHWRYFGTSIINFKHIPHLFVLLLMNLSMYLFAENCPSKRRLLAFLSIVDNPAKISTSDQRCFNVVNQR